MAEKTAIECFKEDLKRVEAQYLPLMGEDTQKFVQIASNYLEANPKLLESTRQSLYAAIMKAAQCRLFIDGQEASLVPFKGVVTMMTGYKGILKMVRNSGELSSINAGVVYEKDVFEYYVDEKGEHLMHKPTFGKDRGAPVHTYCIARTKGNIEPYIEVMTEDEIEACKKSSAAVKFGGDTPWKGPFADEMRKKTVIRRISKRLPMSTDLNVALNSDDDLFNAPTPEEQPAPEPKTKSSRLEKAIAPKQEEHPPEQVPNQLHQPEKNAVTTTTAKKETVTPEKLAKEFSQKVEGIILSMPKIRENPSVSDPKKNRRFSCKIGEAWYGTFDFGLYEKMVEAFDGGYTVQLTFVTKMNKQTPPQPYNDILDIVEHIVEQDDVEVPI